jgi:hypothetical protein
MQFGIDKLKKEIKALKTAGSTSTALVVTPQVNAPSPSQALASAAGADASTNVAACDKRTDCPEGTNPPHPQYYKTDTPALSLVEIFKLVAPDLDAKERLKLKKDITRGKNMVNTTTCSGTGGNGKGEVCIMNQDDMRALFDHKHVQKYASNKAVFLAAWG